MSGTRSTKILIVDDDPVTRLVLRKMLSSQADWEVLEAENGAVAWRLLESGQPVDLCIADVQMPELNGLELLKRIRSTEVLKTLKVILCTTLRDRTTIT